MLATQQAIRGQALPPELITRAGAQRSVDVAVADVLIGATLWRLWGRMGWNDIRQRYRRSMLGPLWLTASMAVMVVSLGVLYAELFRTPIDEFLPYLCIGLLVWNLVASFMTEGGTIFTASESYIKQIRIPYSCHVYRSGWSKLIILAHNSLVYIGVLIYFGIWPGAYALLAIPGLVIVLLNGALASLFIGMVSARFRDFSQLINSIVQVVFFVTPIFWKPEVLKGRPFIVDYNPLFHLIEIVRAPLLGTAPSLKNYFAVLLITTVNIVVVTLFFTRYRSRISYWV